MWWALAGAILIEVVATLSLRASDGFRRKAGDRARIGKDAVHETPRVGQELEDVHRRDVEDGPALHESDRARVEDVEDAVGQGRRPARIPDRRASPRSAAATSGLMRVSGGFGARHQDMSSSMSLISPLPSSRARRTAARASSGVAGNRFRWESGGLPSSHHPPLTVKIGAAGKISGMSGRPREAAAIRSATATSSAMRRTEVTPQRSIFFRSSSDSAWT